MIILLNPFILHTALKALRLDTTVTAITLQRKRVYFSSNLSLLSNLHQMQVTVIQVLAEI